MSTLYDLLGALPDDNAEGLRTAFRRAVKGAHPDLNPGDPDAALKFREIMRANEILSDEDQRSAYDHLLELARLEQESASKHAFAARVHKFASGTMAVVGVLAATIGGCLLFMHISAASVALPHRLSETAAAISADAHAANGKNVANGQNASSAKAESASVLSASVFEQVNAPGDATPLADTGGAPAAHFGPPPVVGTSPSIYISVYRDSVYRDNNPGSTIPGLNQSVRFDPQFPAFDPSMLFYRPQNIVQAFADVVKARPPEKASCSAPVPIAKKQRMAARATPVYLRRVAERNPSREGGFPFANRR